MNIETLVKDHQFVVNEEKRKTIFRQQLGSLLWITQTRYDLAFQISKVATDYTQAVTDPTDTLSTLKLINKIVDKAKSKPVVIWYLPLVPANQAQKLALSGKMTVFAFSDAGYATLRNSSSIQSHLIVLGVPIKRDGILECVGHHIAASSKKISRVSRSTLSSETVALADAVDASLWFKTILTEILFGIFSRNIVLPMSGYTMISPFKKPEPTETLWINETHSSQKPSEKTTYDLEHQRFVTSCKNCGIAKSFDAK